MPTEYRVVCKTKFSCNCPMCPVRGTHHDGPRTYGTTTDADDVVNLVDKAWNVDNVESVTVEQREVSDWTSATGPFG